MVIYLSPQRARALIRETAVKATHHIGDIAPFVLKPPYRQEIRVLENVDISGYRRRIGVEQIDDRTFGLHSDSLNDLMI